MVRVHAEPPQPAVRAPLPTGWTSLDALIGGGWPAGELAEVVGRGRSSLGLAAVRRAQGAGQPAAWVDGTGAFCPATADVDLEQLALVRPGRVARRGPAGRALLAADLLLRSRGFGLLVIDLPVGRPPLSAWFRLSRQAADACSALLLLTRGPSGLAGSAAGLTLRVALVHAPRARWEVAPPPGLAVSVLRRRGAPGIGRALLGPAPDG